MAHPEINKLKHTKRTLDAFRDIKDAAFWKSTYGICGVSYPNVRLLRLCDKSDPIMGELEHGKRRTTEVGVGKIGRVAFGSRNLSKGQ